MAHNKRLPMTNILSLLQSDIHFLSKLLYPFLEPLQCAMVHSVWAIYNNEYTWNGFESKLINVEWHVKIIVSKKNRQFGNRFLYKNNEMGE